ncbi:hypothetical protein [Brevundimonas diminuta]|uniref:hypothetical protein n=1 Tax=Brevundimonas diminuta TaxID=293 RepID=UPI0020935AAD|nr:hypothetical protein [Brevundimonas diminuta]
MSDVRVPTRVEIINAGHMMAGVNQSPAQMRPQKTGAARYGDPLGGFSVVLRRIRKAIVCHRLQP